MSAQSMRMEATPGAADNATFKIEPVSASAFSTDSFSATQHNFHLHPLMQLDQLEQLALRLAPLNEARFIVPGTKADSPFKHESTPPDGRSIEDVFRRIEEPGSWIALYNIQLDEAYRKFLWDEALPSFSRFLKKGEKAFDIRGFIFISAPPSVTPFHIDRENNFWLNIKGRKTICLWDWRDRDVVSGKDIEDFIAFGALDNVKLTDAINARRHEFNCGPGQGVYFPSTTPHMVLSDRDWVKPGDGVSVSIGIVFYTNLTRRNAYIHACNQLLRRLGLSPEFPSKLPLADALKYAGGRAYVEFRKRFRGYKPKPGF